MSKVLILWGGMEFHEPKHTSERFAGVLANDGHDVTTTNDLTMLDNADTLASYDLIVINMTMGSISDQQERNLLQAIRSGVGLGGWHGGLGDTFRDRPNFQYAVGGQWVAHPGDILEYTVQIDTDHEIVAGISAFSMQSEQYYMHIDPGVEVLASTVFSGAHDFWIEGTRMPVVWTKQYEKGRVFYCSLGHVDADFDASPDAATIIQRGLTWAMSR